MIKASHLFSGALSIREEPHSLQHQRGLLGHSYKEVPPPAGHHIALVEAEIQRTNQLVFVHHWDRVKRGGLGEQQYRSQARHSVNIWSVEPIAIGKQSAYKEVIDRKGLAFESCCIWDALSRGKQCFALFVEEQ